MNEKTILFIPSNENHCKIFQSIGIHLKEYKQVFLTQGSYKNEGAEEALTKLGISFTRIDDYKKKDAEFILKKENTGIIVVGNDSDVIPQWFVNVGKKLGISSVLVQDGMMVDIKILSKNVVKSYSDKMTQTNPKLKMLAFKLLLKKQYRKTNYGLGGCTQIHTWGKQSESYFISKGVDRKTIMITGNSKTYTPVSPEKNEKVVLYTPTDFVHMNIVKSEFAKELAQNVCSAVTSIENLRLIIKPHPREDVNLYANLPAKFGLRVEISNEDVTKLLPISTLVISDLSTVGLEAIGLKKPVIVYLPNVELFTVKDNFPNDLIAKNAVLYASDKKSLFEQITKILEGRLTLNNETLGIIENYLGPLDGKSSLRSAAYIENLLN